MEPARSGTQIQAAVRECIGAFWGVGVFSGVVNILMLAGPLYMLQVYDRVLSSRSVPTLVVLTICLAGAYAFQALLDVIRTHVVVRIAGLVDKHLDAAVHTTVVRLALRAAGPAERAQPVRDLDQVRGFLTSAGPVAIVDLPWMPVFLLLCFLIHPWLGILALVGAIVLFTTTILNERASRVPARAMSRENGLRLAIVDLDGRNSESIMAMGMLPALTARWTTINSRYLRAATQVSDVISSYGSVSKVLRLMLQSAMLGLGAYFVIRGELTPGAMIAASIMMGRALAPIETIIANWRSFIAAKDSIRRLSELFKRTASGPEPTALPRPSKRLAVEQLTVVPPGTTKPIVQRVDFSVEAGEAIGVIGPSGSGKSSLARTLVGVWRPALGTVRLDGATLDHWSPESLGPHIGYVSQSVELFEGTVAENIARMASPVNSQAVHEAAAMAGAHDMILRLANGYDTPIGEGGVALSAGQRQRVALARALFGNPFLIVLDEPNSNLDSAGELALLEAIKKLKAQGAAVVIVAHRPAALSVCDKVLYLADGMQRAFGPRDEVLRKVLAPPPPPPAAATANLKVVSDNPSGAER